MLNKIITTVLALVAIIALAEPAAQAQQLRPTPYCSALATPVSRPDTGVPELECDTTFARIRRDEPAALQVLVGTARQPAAVYLVHHAMVRVDVVITSNRQVRLDALSAADGFTLNPHPWSVDNLPRHLTGLVPAGHSAYSVAVEFTGLHWTGQRHIVCRGDRPTRSFSVRSAVFRIDRTGSAC